MQPEQVQLTSVKQIEYSVSRFQKASKLLIQSNDLKKINLYIQSNGKWN